MRSGKVLIVITWVLLIGGLLAVLGRCWALQYRDAERYQSMAFSQQRQIINHDARRGMIIDRNGRVLALSLTSPMVWVDPHFIFKYESPREIAAALAAALAMDEDQLYNRLKENAHKRYLVLRRDVDEEQAGHVEQIPSRGVEVKYAFRRNYPMGKLAMHVIGFTTIGGVGLEGIEASYDEYLAGEPGTMLLRKDVAERPVGSLGEYKSAREGYTVVSTIDAVIQACVEEELEAAVRKFEAQSASALVMNPHNGEILAMANWPCFEPNQIRLNIPELKRNRILTDPYEPGSTFKPITVASAVQGGFVDFDDTIDCLEGPYRGKGFRPIKEYKYYYGKLKVTDILVRSSNIGSAKLAQKMGKTYFHDMVEKFGFGSRTGIDLPGEGVGIFRDSWDDKQHTLTRVGFGQGIAVTPIQLMRAFCCLANGGRLVCPRVVKGIVDSKGQIVKNFGMQEILLNNGETWQEQDRGVRIISSDVSRTLIQESLVGVVAREHGTAHNAHLEEWQVFGKTGTAQVARKDGPGYEENKYISSFIGGAPAENPQVCVLVLLRKPNRSLGLGYTGGMVAAPVVRNILHQTLAYLEVPKSKLQDEVSKLSVGN